MLDLENKSIYTTRVKLDQSSFSRRLYVSQNLKICMINKGEGIWQIGNHCYPVKKNDIVVLNNRQKRIFREVSPTEGIEIIEIGFEPQLFVNRFPWLLFSGEEKYTCKISDSPEVVKLFVEIEWEAREQRYNYRIIIGAKILEILSLIERRYNDLESGSVKISEDMYRVLEYIDENYTSNISLSKAAEVLHTSESNFSRYFIKNMGIGFSQYVMHKRVSYAIHLLQSSEKKVLEIALDCGYNNTASFYKAFRKITKLTPKDYRNTKADDYI